MSKKEKTLDELLEEALVSEDEQPYEIPSNWIWTTLESVGDWGSGGTPSRKHSEYYNGQIPWIKTGELNDCLISDTEEKITELGLKKSSAKLFPKGSVALAMYGATIGKLGILDIDATTNQACAVVNPNNITTSKFLYYYLLANRREIISLGKGGAQPNISQTIIKAFPFVIPPLEEQKRIISKIEILFAKLDEAKRLIDEAKETFELRREAILKLAFTGELTADFRNNNSFEGSQQRLMKIREERYTVVESKKERSELESLFQEEIEVDSNDWLYLKTSAFCHNITCGSTPSKDLSNEGEIPFLKVYNIVNNEVDFEYQPQYIPNEVHQGKLKKSRLQPNDVIMNIVGPPLKKFAIIPERYEAMNMNQAIVRFRPISQVLPKYIYYCLQYEKTLSEVIEATRGVVGQSNISITQSRNLVMPIPSIEEQEQIILKLEALIDKEKEIFNLIPTNKEIEVVKQCIFSKAFKGELGTNDLTDEPAIELLKSILKEKL